ncbi:hypothetical protein KM043_003086 [Ampulex compressa]|nr:hypothetical protein KM043_003086 [Ampulex compressa]
MILRNIFVRFKGCTGQTRRLCTSVTEQETPTSVGFHDEKILPIISKQTYQDEKYIYQKPREVWIENLDTVQEKKLGFITLHPDVFAASPRIDIIHQNVRWQKMYRFVCYAHTRTRAECKGGGRKPWPQKGMGRARHGSIRSPLWKGGEIPNTESSYMNDLIAERNWGPSVLFVDTDDIMPLNITSATDEIRHVNLMPAYGLNVYSMLKHDTLVLTERAARLIEEKILYQLNRPDIMMKKFMLNQQ